MDWDAATYDRIADPMTRWGTDVLDRLPLRGDETVLDAGCGSGRVTERLVERLPRGRVVALDGSPAMVEAARERLGAVRRPGELRGRGPGGAPAAGRRERRRDPVDGDLPLGRATTRRCSGIWPRSLRPGGRLVAQCGGQGNIAAVRAVLAEVGDGWLGPWTFASPEETTRRLEAAGFIARRRPG